MLKTDLEGCHHELRSSLLLQVSNGASMQHIPLSTRIRGGFGGYGCLFFSQHLWGFFEVADLGYLFVFFNSTRIY